MAKIRHLLTADKVIPFGKWKGTTVGQFIETERGVQYLAWCLKNDICDFEPLLVKTIDDWKAKNPDKWDKIKVTATKEVVVTKSEEKFETTPTPDEELPKTHSGGILGMVSVSAFVPPKKGLSDQRQAQWGSW